MKYKNKKLRRNLQKNSRKYKNVYIKLMTIMFLLTIFAFVCLNTIIKDKEFSENENRILQQKPKFTFDRLFEGRYTKKYEKYTVDQIVGRDGFIKVKTKVDWLLGKNSENGVYKGKDGYLIENFNKPNKEYLKENIKAINKFANKHKDINQYMLIAPNSVNILSDKLPNFAPVYDQDKYLEELDKSIDNKVKFINVSDSLKEHKNEYIYYKTDHHWTTLGAYYAFLDFANQAGLDVNPNGYEKYRVSNDFYGTLYSKSGYKVDPDKVDIFTPKDKNDQVIVEYKEEKKKSPTIYNSEALKKKDKYEVFLGGNHPLVDIKTTSESDKVLLLVKDSYANSFVQFLTHYYKEIIMVDPRYYYEDIEKLIKDKNITDMLYLYNSNTFFNDSSLAPVLNNI
ncbi:DHHW family protein [Paraclostridium sordellii]|uniref:DHHW family protein n=1 Tax=Paraclostridium sordellii TaxID=1505 RepID=UPI0005E8D1F0|nr:DHHW family protein [Paeniclostridium sordellii]CEN21433.1 membrane protein [[Clostridium] sordellii] [Paeniclostridium sordellii]